MKTVMPKQATQAQIEGAIKAGYTVHSANDDSQGFAYCIDGDFSQEFATAQAAWNAAAIEYASA